MTITAIDVAMHLSSNTGPIQSFQDEVCSKGEKWVEHPLTLVHKEELNSKDALVWDAYQAS